MKLVYWIAPAEGDCACYVIRCRTRREVLEELARLDDDERASYGKPLKVEMKYTSAFDLLCQCLETVGVGEPKGRA